MSHPLGMQDVIRRTGAEHFHSGTTALGFDLLSFWQWSCSDLLSNATRGVIAEFLVASALGVAAGGVRHEWAAYDLVTPEGVTVEVKSAAYLQRWHQDRLSSISFVVTKTRAWDPRTNRMSDEVARQAQVYVFALLAHQDKSTVDPLNLDQWVFYVLPTAVLDNRTRSQHSIALRTLQTLSGGPVAYQGLRAAIVQAHVASANPTVAPEAPRSESG
jgi:hypothetical protein